MLLPPQESGTTPQLRRIVAGSFTPPLVVDPFVEPSPAPPPPTPGTGTQYAFVFDPAATPGANVYNLWEPLYAAMSAIAGPKLVEVVGNAEIAARGTPYDLDEITFVPSDAGAANLVIADGATINPGTLHFGDGLNVVYEGTSGPCMTATMGGHGALIDVFLANLICTGGQPFLSAAAGAHAIVLLRDHSMMTGSGNLAVAGAVNVLVLGGSNVAASALGAGAQSAYDDTSNISLPQAGSVKMASAAGSVSYDPMGVWTVNPPTEVNDAVTRLIAILANNAQVQNGVSAPLPNPTWGIAAKLTNFIMTAGGAGILRVDSTATIKNNDAVGAHDMNLGVLAVPTGTLAPFVPTYYLPVVTIPAGADGSAVSLPFIFDGPPLTPGTGYDVYLLATAADASGMLELTTGVLVAQETY